jgi:hypothetical protein
VRFEAEAGEPALEEALRQRHVVDDPADHVWIDVDVEVERAAHQLAGFL